MIKSELIQKLATANPHLYQRDIERIVNVIFDEIVAALSRGERVELRGFGAFTVKHRAARMGRNPKTGEPMHINASKSVGFSPSAALKASLKEIEAPAAAPAAE